MHLASVLISLLSSILIFNNTSKIDFQIHQADLQLQEANRLIAANQLDLVLSALEHFNSGVEKADNLVRHDGSVNQVQRSLLFNHTVSDQTDLLIQMYGSCNNARIKQAIRNSLKKIQSENYQKDKICSFYKSIQSDPTLTGTERQFLFQQIQMCNPSSS